MAETADGMGLAPPIALWRGAARILSVARGAQKAAMDELADLNRELFKDFIESMHSASLLSSEFWHAKTADAAITAIEEFTIRQEQILRCASHRWTEHCHRLMDGALHPNGQQAGGRNG